MSQIKVNSIVPVGGLPSGANGGIIQTVYTQTNTGVQTSGTTYVDSGMTATITPSSNSSKILIIASFHVQLYRDATEIGAKIQLVRGSTAISADNFCRMPSSSEAWPFADINLDSPGTTSATTYKVQCKAETNEVFVNRDGSNRDFGMSYITVMEVGM